MKSDAWQYCRLVAIVTRDIPGRSREVARSGVIEPSTRGRFRLAILLILPFLFLSGVDAADPGRQPGLEWLDLPNSIDGKTPRLQSTEDSLLLSWVSGSGDDAQLRFGAYRQGGWTTPATIAKGDGWLINYADYAQLLPLSDRVYLAVWLELTSFVNNDYRFNTRLSLDAGKTWIASGYPAELKDFEQHGFASASLLDGVITFYWITGFRGDGSLFRATLDMSGRWSKPVLIDQRVCSCCHTAVSKSATLVYRDRSETEVRDIAVIANAQDSKISEIVHADNWEIAGCPRNGPAIAEQDNLAAIAWFSDANDSATVKLAIGRRVNPREWRITELESSVSPGFVDIAWLGPERLVVSSLSSGNDSIYIKLHLAQVTDSIVRVEQVIEIPVSAVSGYPSLAKLGDSVYLAFYSPDNDKINLARINWHP